MKTSDILNDAWEHFQKAIKESQWQRAINQVRGGGGVSEDWGGIKDPSIVVDRKKCHRTDLAV
jgi:hypothetical protein